MKADFGSRHFFIGIVFLFSYFLLYKLLMIRNCPAVKNGVVMFDSCFIWAPDKNIINLHPSSIHIITGKVTIFNYIFYPADLTYKMWSN